MFEKKILKKIFFQSRRLRPMSEHLSIVEAFPPDQCTRQKKKIF